MFFYSKFIRKIGTDTLEASKKKIIQPRVVATKIGVRKSNEQHTFVLPVERIFSLTVESSRKRKSAAELTHSFIIDTHTQKGFQTRNMCIIFLSWNSSLGHYNAQESCVADV